MFGRNVRRPQTLPVGHPLAALLGLLGGAGAAGLPRQELSTDSEDHAEHEPKYATPESEAKFTDPRGQCPNPNCRIDHVTHAQQARDVFVEFIDAILATPFITNSEKDHIITGALAPFARLIVLEQNGVAMRRQPNDRTPDDVYARLGEPTLAPATSRLEAFLNRIAGVSRGEISDAELTEGWE